MNESARLFLIDEKDTEVIEALRGYPVADKIDLLDQFEFSSYVEMLEAVEKMRDDNNKQ